MNVLLGNTTAVRIPNAKIPKDLTVVSQVCMISCVFLPVHHLLLLVCILFFVIFHRNLKQVVVVVVVVF